jgi:hypothetical protein
MVRNTKSVKVKKLFNGYASVRDYIVAKYIAQKKSLIINYYGKLMTIPYEHLLTASQLHRTKFKSRFNGETYELIDFLFQEDEKERDLYDL